MAETEEQQLTPSEELALEVLAARYRTGEVWWTFLDKHGKAVRGLEEKGLAQSMHGVVGGTFRAALTDAGKKVALSESYAPPREVGERACTFCELAQGDGREKALYANRAVFVVADENPKAQEHLLVIPWQHVESLAGADANTVLALMQMVQKVGRVLGDYRVVVNVGAGGKQTVPHLHAHVLSGPEVGEPGFARGVH